MMKLLIAFLIMTSVFAEYNMSFDCKRQEKTFNFNLNFDRNVIVVSNSTFFGNDIPPQGKSLGLFKEGDNNYSFEYTWYYTATYNLDFRNTKDLWEYNQGEQLDMFMTYDDRDGMWENDVKFSFVVSKSDH